METGVPWSLQQTPVGQSKHRGLGSRTSPHHLSR